jgi:NADPH-dependent 2,4-dienoyl-CoA reductase/sulfur reductase-like enzyme/nitrite reductase/ring-hydroxylating ferredoxin subunit
MKQKRYKFLARLSELPDGKLTVRKLGSKEFLLLRRGDQVSISSNKCPHRGARLSEGLAFGREVVCPCHNARFDLGSGCMLSPPALDDIPTYRTAREGEEILVGPVREDQGLCLPSLGSPAGERGRTILLVGAGAAGAAAAEALRREGFEGRVVMLGAEPEPPYDRTALSKGLLCGSVPVEELPLRPPEFYEAMGIELFTGVRVSSLEAAERRVVLEDGRRMQYHRLLLATGGRPRKLQVPGADLEGCCYLRSRADALRLMEALPAAERPVIVGAGFIGLEVASALRKRGLPVQVVAPESVPMAASLGEDLGSWVRGRHESRGVRFLLDRGVREFRGVGRVEEIVLSDGSTLEADLAVVGVGIEPAVEILRGAAEKRGVPVDEHFRTGLPGVYAAGDAALVPGPDGKNVRVEHWAEAQRQGQQAARSMLGKGGAYRSVPFYWTEQQELTLKCVGLPSGRHRRVMRGTLAGESFIVGFFEGSTLRAAVAVDRDRELIAAGELMRTSAGLTPERFLSLVV